MNRWQELAVVVLAKTTHEQSIANLCWRERPLRASQHGADSIGQADVLVIVALWISDWLQDSNNLSHLGNFKIKLFSTC